MKQTNKKKMGEKVEFVENAVYGCGGQWTNPGLSNGAQLCAMGYEICTEARAVELGLHFFFSLSLFFIFCTQKYICFCFAKMRNKKKIKTMKRKKKK